MSNSRTGAGNVYMMSPEHHVMPESTDVLKNKQKTYTDGGLSKGHKNQLREFSTGKYGTI